MIHLFAHLKQLAASLPHLAGNQKVLTPLILNSLRFKTHKELDGSTGLVEFSFTAMLKLIAHNIGDKVFDSKGTPIQRVGITLNICKMELT